MMIGSLVPELSTMAWKPLRSRDMDIIVKLKPHKVLHMKIDCNCPSDFGEKIMFAIQ